MKLKFSCPSKTFLTGEYAVLCGAPGLVLTHEPRFELIVSTNGTGVVQGIHPQSPAGYWVRTSRVFFESMDVIFTDPFSGAGGFGASGAQFLLVHALTTWLQSSTSKLMQGLDVSAVWSDFRVITKDRQSGADIVAQA